jgi:GGDEF domain-containing protein
LLLEEADPGTVDQVLNRLQGLLAERHFPGEECFPAGKLSISHGHVLCRDENRSYEEILAAADAALYEYKNQSKVENCR